MQGSDPLLRPRRSHSAQSLGCPLTMQPRSLSGGRGCVPHCVAAAGCAAAPLPAGWPAPPGAHSRPLCAGCAASTWLPHGPPQRCSGRRPPASSKQRSGMHAHVFGMHSICVCVFLQPASSAAPSVHNVSGGHLPADDKHGNDADPADGNHSSQRHSPADNRQQVACLLETVRGDGLHEDPAKGSCLSVRLRECSTSGAAEHMPGAT